MTSGNKVGMAPAAQDLKIGDSYQGGIIFYLDGTKTHGLIAAPTDQSTGLQWGCAGSTTNATDPSVGAGRQNTTAIVAKCGDPEFAALTCVQLDLSGFKDWYLPSRSEVLLMFNNLYKKGWGSFSTVSYWSSTEADADNGFMVNFVDGNPLPKAKSVKYYVRAIRSF